MANPTKFNGPVLYSGDLNRKSPFKDLPVSLNPDFTTIMEDYVGKTVNSNELNFQAIASGTHGIVDQSYVTPAGDGDENTRKGIAFISSAPTAALPVNSGGNLYTNRIWQPGRANNNHMVETSISLSQPRESDFFFGYRVYPFSSNPAIEGWKFGFAVNNADDSQEIKIVSAIGASTNDIGTGRYIGVGDSQFNHRVLSIRTYTIGVTQTIAEFYINRTLVYTLSTPKNTTFATTAVYSCFMSFEKKRPLNNSVNVFLQSGISASDTTFVLENDIYLREYPDESFDLTGIYAGQVIKIGSEEMFVVSANTSFSTVPTVTVTRGYNGTTATSHLAGATVVDSSAAAFVDYIFSTAQRVDSSGYRTGSGFLVERNSKA